MKKIKFLKSPVGAFLLAYFENDIADIEENLATEIIESGFGIEVIEETLEIISELNSEETLEVKPKKRK